MCDEVFNGTVECPVAPGPIEFVKTIDIPEHIPKVRVWAYMSKNELLLTIK